VLKYIYILQNKLNLPHYARVMSMATGELTEHIQRTLQIQSFYQQPARLLNKLPKRSPQLTSPGSHSSRWSHDGFQLGLGLTRKKETYRIPNSFGPKPYVTVLFSTKKQPRKIRSHSVHITIANGIRNIISYLVTSIKF